MTFRSSSLFICLTGVGGVVREYSQTSWCGVPFNLIIVPDRQRYAFFKYKTAFLAIQFICDRRIQCGTKHVGNSVFYM